MSTGTRQIAGLAAAAMLVIWPHSLGAQTLRPVITDDAAPLPPLRARTIPPSRTRSEPPGEPQNTPQVRLRPTSIDPAAEPSDADGETDAPVALPPGLRPATRDGDPDALVTETQPIDGAPDTVPEEGSPDGLDPVLWDARSADDAAAFERPPAGYDPAQFQAEIAPLLDRRTDRLFRLEPWQARGVRIGSFILYPQVDVGAAHVSNLFRSPQARGDQAFELRPSLRLVSAWRTHALELRATGLLTYFDGFPTEDDRAYSLEARGRIDVSKRTSVTALALRDVVQEARGTLETRLRGGARGDVTSDLAGLTLDHRFNRLAIQLRGTVLQRTFEDGVVASGSAAAGSTSVSNRDRDVVTTEEAVRVGWAFKPTLIAFAETGLNQRTFKAASASDGIKRDSTGERYRVGVGFGTAGQILRGEISLGWGRQTPDDARLAVIDGVIVDANLAWRVDATTAVLLRASTDVTETSTALSGGGLTRRATAEVRHAFMRPLIGYLGIGVAATDYEASTISEHQSDINAGLEYYLAPEAIIYTRWQHSQFRTTLLGGNWDSDEIRVGVRLRQ